MIFHSNEFLLEFIKMENYSSRDIAYALTQCYYFYLHKRRRINEIQWKYIGHRVRIRIKVHSATAAETYQNACK